MRKIFLFMMVLACGCSTSYTIQPSHNADIPGTGDVKVVTIKNTPLPQVWSDHKLVTYAPDVCADKGVDILKTQGFTDVIKNNTYVYGNYVNNRAAIKCTEVEEKTFVYAIVAGPDVEIVERLRNDIVNQL